jgi:hypothetical protein
VPDAPRTLPQCPQAAAARRAPDTLVWTAARVQVLLPPQTPRAGGWRPLPPPAGRAWTVDRRRPPRPRPAQGRRGRVRGGERPSGQHLAAIPDVQRTRPRRPVPRTPLGSGPSRRSRQTSAVQMWDSGRGLRTPAAPQAARTVDTRDGGMARGHCGSGLLDSRQRNRLLPLACPAGNGTARCGIGQHRHGQTARSVAWWSASVWSAPDGSGLLRLGASSTPSDPDGSRRIVWMIKRMIKGHPTENRMARLVRARFESTLSAVGHRPAPQSRSQ